jgi:hypothetical protein
MTLALSFPVVFSIDRAITVLGSGILTLFGAGIAIAVGRVQEKYKRKERQRELAGALLVECAHIRRELGAPRDPMLELSAYDLTMAPPEIHRWMQQLIPGSAVIDPRIVDSFIQLDTQLANFAIVVPLCRAARSTAESTQIDFERAERARNITLMSGMGALVPGMAGTLSAFAR